MKKKKKVRRIKGVIVLIFFAEASPPKHSNKGARVEPIRASVDSEPGDEDKDGRGQAGGYNPADYEGLDVSSEVKDLFKYITR